MPRDTSIQSVLVIGSGPIVIGQACEFDYSGTQAIKVLKKEGLRVSLVNSNPATIMTDPAMADRFDAMRFSGPIGTLLAEEQDRVIASFLGPLAGRTVLDVGTGTGRAAIGLARRGARVTGLDASAEMLRVARARAAEAGVDAAFEVGDAHQLAYGDRAFHCAVSLRVLMHTPDWRRCLAELCRVAGDRVVFDYPSAVSAAALQAGWRWALAAAGRTSFRLPFYPMLHDAVHIPPPYCLRCSYGLTFPECRLRCALALDETIQNIGPSAVSAFIGETVSGATLAVYPPPPGYWPLVRQICDRHGVLLILDEVMCGMGRTGRWFAAEHYDVVPDIMTLGKGLSGGTMALSAVATSTAHMETIRGHAGGFAHGGTFSHNAVACAAGLAAVGILERERLVERAAALGENLGGKLASRFGASPWVADIRGLGMMWGLEIVKERATLQPFARSEKVTEKIWKALFEEGVIVYKSVAMAGTDGDGLVVAPPFVITEEQIDLVVEKLAFAIEKTLSAFSRDSTP